MTTFTYDSLSLTSFNEVVGIWLDGFKTRKLFTRTDYNKIKDILENPKKKNRIYQLQTLGQKKTLFFKKSGLIMW